MKHVWILNHYANEPGAAGITRHFDLASNLPSHGWKATLIAASVEHPSGIQRLGPREFSRAELCSDVPFLWIRTPKYKGNGLGRILNILVYTYRALIPAYTRKLPPPDVVVGSSFHPFAALAGALLARRYHVPFVFEVRDLWPQTMIDLGKISDRSLIARMMRWNERWLYRAAKRIIVLLPYASSYIASCGVEKEKVVWIPNGVEMSNYTKYEQRESDGTAYRPASTTFNLMYLGTHGLANGLFTLLHAMKLISARTPAGAIHLRMIGDGVAKQELMRTARQLNLQNVTFEDTVPKNLIPQYARQADAFVITVLGLPQLYRYGISMNKIFDYLAAGRPIVIASNAANNPVQEAGAGVAVAPDDPEALAEGILKVYQMPPAVRERLGQSGRQYVEQHHSCSQLAERMARTLDQCLGSTHLAR